MKRNILLLFIIFPLLAADCRKKDSATCHHNLKIQNNSGDTVIWAFKYTHDTLCVLRGFEIVPYNYDEYDFGKICWEEELANGKTTEIFIVDPAFYNQPNVFYRSDSITLKNSVLKYIELTLDKAKKSNFVVAYP